MGWIGQFCRVAFGCCAGGGCSLAETSLDMTISMTGMGSLAPSNGDSAGFSGAVNELKDPLDLKLSCRTSSLANCAILSLNGVIFAQIVGNITFSN